MSIIDIREAFDPSRSSIAAQPNGAYYPLPSGGLRSQRDSGSVDTKVDFIL
jgi:hypothetical protein